MTQVQQPQGAPRAGGQSRSARRRSREFALQAIYAWLLQSGPDNTGADDIGLIEAHVRENQEFTQADARWFDTLWSGVTRDAAELRSLFTPFIDRPLEELSPVEHGILLIGSFELSHQPDVPYRVAINEAVELAKSFGGTDGFKFINGVLDRVAAQVRQAEVSRANSKP